MRVGIAFGSNQGDRLEQLRAARLALLGAKSVSGPVLQSSVYETDPIDSEPGAAAFLNAVAEVECELHPTLILTELQRIEAAMGRPSKRPRNAPRTIDLDILYAGNLVLHNAEVVIPHPRLHLRRFVLQPLADIRPELILPGREPSVAQLLSALQDPAGVELFADSSDW